MSYFQIMGITVLVIVVVLVTVAIMSLVIKLTDRFSYPVQAAIVMSALALAVVNAMYGLVTVSTKIGGME